MSHSRSPHSNNSLKCNCYNIPYDRSISMHPCMHILFQRLITHVSKLLLQTHKFSGKSYLTLNKPKLGLIYFIWITIKMYLQQQNMREAWYVDMQQHLFPFGFYCCSFLLTPNDTKFD
jgi:hypothetical protein